jgi:beta-glucosidase
MLARLGVGAYRFSLAWPRIQPDGRGPVNPRGLDHYSRLVDSLLEAGITPVVTLYHWDLPQALQDEGGWAARDTAGAFAGFAAIAAGALGDRVHRWITLNEPWGSAAAGYRDGRVAPGITDPAQAVAANHHLLLAHGQGTAAIRACSPSPAQAGITLGLACVRPASPEAAGHALELEARQNGCYLGPLFSGAYPERLGADFSPALAAGLVREGDFGIIREPIDFLGVNFYGPQYVGVLAADGQPRRGETAIPDGYVTVRPDGLPVTAIDCLVEPDALHELLTRVVAPATGGLPVYITENGSAWHDYVTPDGTIEDEERQAYLRGHLAAVHRAIADGVDVRGYFVWSLLDNYEWAEGYAQRFGLVFVDYGTQKRILKRSGELYASVVRANALPA